MREAFKDVILGFLEAVLENFIDDCLDQECPHCNRPLNLPDEERIKNWLKGEK